MNRQPYPGEQVSRRTMITTGLQVVAVVVAAGLVLYPLLTQDLAQHKLQQRIDRGMKYLLMAEGALAAWQNEKGTPMKPEREALPSGPFIDWFAERRGGQPYFREEARVARLDMFGPSGPFVDSLFYAASGDAWVLVSRGPDGDFDVTKSFSEKPPWTIMTYDPTNGLYSSGDLWVGRLRTEDP